jgi:HSP20 family protein
MAEIDVKNQSSSSKQGSESGSQGLQRQHGGEGLSRNRGWDPWGVALSPADFFSSNPFTMMRRMSDEMDRLFGQLYGQTSSGSGAWYPAVEVHEQNGQLQVHADLPGMKPEDVKVEITDDSLIIRGERKSEREHHVGKAYRSERRYGEFYREIALPEGVQADQAKAQFRDGVLQITVPVPEQTSRRREIPIGTGETAGRATGQTSGQTGSQSGSQSKPASSTQAGQSTSTASKTSAA